MVTGDNAVTARAIEAGIFDPTKKKRRDDLEGPVFRKMSRAEQESVAMKIRYHAFSLRTSWYYVTTRELVKLSRYR